MRLDFKGFARIGGRVLNPLGGNWGIFGSGDARCDVRCGDRTPWTKAAAVPPRPVASSRYPW